MATVNNTSRPKTASAAIGKIVAVYDYRDESGEVLYQVVRYDTKGFRQHIPNGSGTWTYSLNGTRRVLYRLPELLSSDSIVWLVEGRRTRAAWPIWA